MGTNFYVGAPPTCNNPEHTERLHIGKSSGGWKFAFHAIPEQGLTSWAAWRDYLEQATQAGRQIRDEYDREISLADFAERGTKRWAPRGHDAPLCHVDDASLHGWPRWAHDPEGFDFYEGYFS